MTGPPELELLYEDAHVVAVAKPAGLLTQGTPGGEPTLEDALRRRLRPSDPGSLYLGTLHRLDRPVSGVVLWARTPRAARRLAAQFAGRTTQKVYWAVVGPLADAPAPGSTGVWEDHLIDPAGPRGVAAVVDAATPGARRAVTRVERPGGGTPGAIGTPEGLVGLWLRPETGRTHQLRVQAASRGLPVWGDTAYGSTRPFPVGPGIALHARALTFEHPALHRPLTVSAPPPAAWVEAGVTVTGG